MNVSSDKECTVFLLEMPTGEYKAVLDQPGRAAFTASLLYDVLTLTT